RLVLLHAGKEELNFCIAQSGKLPTNVFDVQLAAGFVGLGHPISYANLVQKLIGAGVGSLETRTDWRRRPLADKQIEYALSDVRYLKPIHDRITALLRELGRYSWFEEETADFLASVRVREDGDRWFRLPGAGSLPSRSLSVLRELATWRDQRARQV